MVTAMVKVKFCGLKQVCDVQWANRLRPDYAGFVFAGKKRRISFVEAAELRRILDDRIPAVGVFVDATMEYIEKAVRAASLSMIQLHGHEDDAYIQALHQKLGLPVVKAFSIEREEDVERANRSAAHYVLVDHGPGGTGKAFDWSCLRKMKRPYFLAGGLTADNVRQALALHPFVLDVSSGIERDGAKDYDKMKQFLAAVRQQEE